MTISTAIPGSIASPADAARAAIRYLAEHRILPTPANYRSAWERVGGPWLSPEAEQVAQAAVQALLRSGDTQTPEHAALAQAVLDQRWSDALAMLGRVARPAQAPAPDADPAVRRQLAELRKVNAELREIVVALCDTCIAAGEGSGWLEGQVELVRNAVLSESDRRSLSAARSLLQQAASAQRTIAHGRRSAVSALRDLLPHLFEQMSALGERSTGFTQQLHDHTRAIAEADSIETITQQVRRLLDDARTMHETVDRTRLDIESGRERAQALENEVARLEQQLADASQRLLTDHLTSAASRAGLEKAFEEAVAAMRIDRVPLAVALLDIDDFKKVNDALGHQAGDGALRHLARVLQSKVRASDTVARYGGEEFVILMPGLTIGGARDLLVRVQRDLTTEVYLHDARQIFITFSAGATQVRDGDTLQTVLARADEAMYQAKHSGKNCVATA
ncbi:MAG TPA: diguanylate cyclase [Burkholderiaceae bacterium]|nr:diguanylate cyclase [Burkholderiaceae bacterium]